MSTTIDERVVGMKFDNKNFEDNVATTMSTLDKFKEKLDLKGATKGLEEIDATSRKIDLSALTGAAETVGLKFNAMYTIADQALRNIVDSAMAAGKRIASALTIDPIKTGLSEYETQINAVQTILANTESKGSTLSDVTAALDELNTYADKTIYNFTEMTRNIGTFTAAGVDLDTSVTAIQGIANLAAVSGSNAQQASVAMYQLSQALSSGSIKLQDWNSVTNAGMGGQLFQDALKETSRVMLKRSEMVQKMSKAQIAAYKEEHGYTDEQIKAIKAYNLDVDKIIKDKGSFRESLKSGWLSSEVLLETLDKFTMGTEGLTEAEIANNREKLKSKGYTDEQIDAVFKLGDTATNAATKVKTFTQLWDTLQETAQSGWTNTWEILLGDFEEAKVLFSDLYGLFAPMIEASGNARNELLQGWKDAGGRNDLIDSVYNIVDGVLSIVKPIKEAFRDIFPPITVQQLVNFTKGIKDLTAKLTLSETTSNNLKRTFKGLFAVMDIVKQAFSAMFKLVKPLFGTVDDLGGGVLGLTASFGDWLVALDESIKNGNIFGKAVDKIHAAFAKFKSFIQPAIDECKNFGKAFNEAFGESMSKVNVRLEPLKAVGTAILSVFTSLGKVASTVAPWIMAAVKGIGNVIGSFVEHIASSIQGADYNSLFDVVNGGLITAIGVFIAKFINSGKGLLDNAGGFLEGINDILGGVSDALGSFSESLKADALKKIATAIAILAASLLVLSFIDSEKLTLSLVAISTLFAELMGSMSIFSKIAGGGVKGLGSMSIAMVGLSTALLILSAALKVMSTMSWSEMAVGLIAMAVSMAALVATVKFLPERQLVGVALGIQMLCGGLLVLSAALKIMSTISIGKMSVALLGLVGGLAALVAAVNFLPKDTALRALGMTGLATAMVIMASALKIMGSMSVGEVAKSVALMASSLGILVGAMKLMKSALPGAAVMMLVAPALVVLAGALKLMGTMSVGDIAKSLVVLAGSLLLIAAATSLMKTALSGAAALVVVSAALLLLVPALKMLGNMSGEEIARSLITLAGALTILGLGALILKPLIPTLLSLAGVFVLFGTACAMVGVGTLALAAGLTAIAASGGALALSITTIVSSLVALIPYILEQVGLGIIKLCEVIAGGAVAIGKALTVVVVALVDALVASVPKLAEGALVLVMGLLEALIKYTPTIVNFLFDFVVGLINGIAARLPDLIQAGVNLVMSLFSGILGALKVIDTSTLLQGTIAVGLMAGLMYVLSTIAALTPGALLGVLSMGAVIAELALVLAAIGALAQIPGLSWLISEGGYFLETIGTALGQFIGGLVGGIAQGFTSSFAAIALDLSEFMTNLQPFIEGARSFDAGTMSGVMSLIDVIMALTGAGIVEGLTSWITGGSSITKFGEELASFGPNFKAYADSVSGIDASAITASAEAAKALAEMTSHIPNEGGVASWFAGENSIAKFGTDLISLGEGLKGFSVAIDGVNPEAIISAAGAAKALSEMTASIPNEGGVAAWFAGDNSVSKFSEDMLKLGEGLSGFSTSIVGIDPEAIIAASNAAKALAQMTTYIPNQGGMMAWFAGDNSVSKFSEDLLVLGEGLSGFSVSIMGVNTESLTAAANAAKALAQMTSYIPNEGGMASWFAGESSVSKFSTDLVKLGQGLSGFSMAITGVNSESLLSAANAAKALAEMTAYIPNEGGVKSWFAGEASLSKFSTDLVSLGEGLKGFSTSVEGVNSENITAAANAAKALAEMTAVIPNEGGIKSWFTGETSIAKFADKLPELGAGLKGFGESVTGIEPESVTAAANAAKALGEMTSVVPSKTDKLISFGDNLNKFGVSLKDYFTKTSDISGESISATENIVGAVKDAANLDSGKIKSTATAINEIAKSIKDLSKVPGDSAEGFKKALKDLGETSVDTFIDSFKGLNPDIKKVAKEAITEFVNGVKDQMSKAKTACKGAADECAEAMADKAGAFKQAGKDLVTGFANGISSNTYLAEAKAKAMATAAANAAKKALDEHSPSKVFYGIGDFAGKGFVNALDDYGKKSYSAGSSMAMSARNGLRDAVARIKNLIDGNDDMQPTIRPVLDLRDVESGAGEISRLFGSGASVGVATNIGAIGGLMSRRNQAGNDELISAINSLRRDLGKVGNTTYTIEGITYDDGSNISDAVKSIVRAARVERRI